MRFVAQRERFTRRRVHDETHVVVQMRRFAAARRNFVAVQVEYRGLDDEIAQARFFLRLAQCRTRKVMIA